MAVSSRLPLEFIAVVGVLVITIAIVQVPRTNMRPPDLLGPDYQVRSQLPEDAGTLTVPPDSETIGAEPVSLRIERLEAELQASLRELERARAEVAAARRRLERGREGEGQQR